MKTEIKKPIKSGIILEPIVQSDYIFGVSAIDNEVKVESGNWNPYLPKNEKQRQGFESMCCTNFSSTTAIEILFTRLIEEKIMSVGNMKWLFDKGYFDDSGHINFSDRFDALVSGTIFNSGNTLKAPAEAKHKFGMIPEKMLPWTDDYITYFNKAKITPEMYSLGQEFLTRFPINYEMVYAKDFAEALKVSPLAGACFAWNGISMGVYKRVENPINHAIAIIKPPTYWQIMDSYEPWIKNLVDNYLFLDYAIRYIVRENTDVPDSSIKTNMYSLKRDIKNTNEVYAFSEDGIAKRHIANKGTLVEGNKGPDRYWVWDNTFTIPWGTQEEFDKATEMAEIVLLPKDSDYDKTGGGFSLWNWIKKLFGKK